MPFLELTVQCRRDVQPRFEQAFEDVGALAVTLLDADADTDDEHAILEPGVGETPLWEGLALTALFPGDADPLRVLVHSQVAAVPNGADPVVRIIDPFDCHAGQPLDDRHQLGRGIP